MQASLQHKNRPHKKGKLATRSYPVVASAYAIQCNKQQEPASRVQELMLE